MEWFVCVINPKMSSSPMASGSERGPETCFYISGLTGSLKDVISTVTFFSPPSLWHAYWKLLAVIWGFPNDQQWKNYCSFYFGPSSERPEKWWCLVENSLEGHLWLVPWKTVHPGQAAATPQVPLTWAVTLLSVHKVSRTAFSSPASSSDFLPRGGMFDLLLVTEGNFCTELLSMHTLYIPD